MAKVLVLGGNGFIGSHLVDSLVEQGHEVTCLCILDNRLPENLSHLEGKIKILDGDFRDLNTLENAVKDSEYVFHMLSFSTPASGVHEHLADIENNVKGTFNLLHLCHKHGIKKIIYPSSGGAIYGNQLRDKLDENSPTNPISFYGLSKQNIENYLRFFHNTNELDYMIFRISNPFGPRQNPLGKQGLIAVSLLAIKEGRPITIYGDGNSTRDYIYVTDVADLMATTFDKETQYKLYNLGSGTGYSINDILSIYRSDLGLDFIVDHKPSRGTDVLRIVLDVNRIAEEFNFSPQVDILEGIQVSWDYIKNKDFNSNR